MLDRWGNSPLKEAVFHANAAVAAQLREKGGTLQMEPSKLANELCRLAHVAKCDGGEEAAGCMTRLALLLETAPEIDQCREIRVRILPLRVGLVGLLLAISRALASRSVAIDASSRTLRTTR